MINDYLKCILSNGRKQTSYKLYLFKAILKFIDSNTYCVDFYNLGCMMIAVSYFDSNLYYNYKSMNDRLICMKSFLITECNYFGNKDEVSIYGDLLAIESKKVINEIKSLVQYVPYLLLSFGQWDDELNGLVVQKRNRKIEELSQLYKNDNLYYIDKNKIYLNEFYVQEIRRNYSEIVVMIDDLIRQYFVG